MLPYFRVGAYGSDDPDRRRLPSIARGRIRTLTGCDVDFADITIIGDTPLDVDCARACGGRAVAVATGQHSISELAACDPDDVFPSFADVDMAVRNACTQPAMLEGVWEFPVTNFVAGLWKRERAKHKTVENRDIGEPQSQAQVPSHRQLRLPSLARWKRARRWRER